MLILSGPCHLHTSSGGESFTTFPGPTLCFDGSVFCFFFTIYGLFWEREREREREKERETERDRETETETGRDQTKTNRRTDRQTDRHTNIRVDRLKKEGGGGGRNDLTQVESLRHRHTGLLVERQVHKYKDNKRERETDR